MASNGTIVVEGDDEAEERLVEAEIKRLSEEILQKIEDGLEPTSKIILTLKKQKGDKLRELAEVQELKRVKAVQEEALESGLVSSPTMKSDVEEDCPLCFDPIPNPIRYDDKTYAPYSCCGKNICLPCNETFRTAATNARSLAEHYRLNACPFCREPLINEGDKGREIQRIMTKATAGKRRYQFEMASRYSSGDGIGRDLKQALHWLLLAADQEDISAQYTLGEIYNKGSADFGVSPTPDKAKELFSAAASRGCCRSQHAMGSLARASSGMYNAEALRWFTLSAAQQYEQAEFELGYIYDTGSSDVDKDPYKAIYWTKRAALSGDAIALTYLPNLLIQLATQEYGEIFHVGLNVLPEVLYWKRKAAASNCNIFGSEKPKEIKKDIGKRCACCGKPAGTDVKLNRCGRCKVAMYCGKECQRKHWKMGHKAVCFPVNN